MSALAFAAAIAVGGLGLSTALPDTAHAQGGPGGSPGGGNDARRAVIQSLTPAERQKFFAMSAEEKQKFMARRLKKSGNNQAGRGRPGGPGGGGPGGRGGSGGRRGFPAPLVEIADVLKEPLVQVYPITGRLVPRQKSVIAARIKGNVAEVKVEVGDHVKKGDIIALLATDRLKLAADLRAAEVLQARAKWKAAQAQVDLLNQEVKRLAGLRKSAAFSQARYDDKRQGVVKALASVDETAAALRKARAQRDLARIDLKDAEIKAPFSGAVTVRHVSSGAYVNAGSAIVTLLDNETLEIEADVPSVRIAGLKPGAMIDVQISAKRSITARVRAIVPDENPLARTQAVRFTPVNAGTGGFVANQSVVVKVPQGTRRDVVTVPKDAIVNRANGKVVFVFAGGRVRPVNVVIGEAFAGKFEIRSGLTAGQKVVVKGNELLRPGQPVRATNPGGPGARPPAGGAVAGRGGRGGPPGGAGGPGASGGRGGGGANAGRRAIIQSLSPEERQKFFAMSPEEKRKFMARKLDQAGKG